MTIPNRPEETITLVGGGLAGSLLAVFLAQRGFQVEVFERRPDMRTEQISAGRSINLALSRRGIHALQQVGLYQEIEPLIIPMRGRMIHNLDGELRFQPYGQNDDEVINSVSRGELNMRLLSLAEKHENVHLHFHTRCTGVDLNSGELEFYDEQSGEMLTRTARRIIGTDGSASEIRNSMQRSGRFNFSQHYLDHGYKELTIPPGPKGAFRMEKNALHIWPRGSYMLIALPNLDGSFTCTLFLPFEGENSFEKLTTPERVRDFFQQHFPDAVPLLTNLTEEFFANPTGAMVTIKCFPWHAGDLCLLLGDAAHAIVPFFGQGMNCAFEDCTYLDACVEAHWPDWQKIFHSFETMRKKDADAIADMAYDNFIEMRDRVADPAFLLRKQVELELEKKYPQQFLPKYSMVSFHRTPYSVAQNAGRIQERILRQLCDGIERIDQIDWQKAGELIQSELDSSQFSAMPES